MRLFALIIAIICFQITTPTTDIKLPDIPTTPIRRIDLANLSLHEQTKSIKNHIATGKPVIFQHSSISKWPALNKWKSTEYLSQAFNHHPLAVKVANHPVFTLFALDAKRGDETVLQGGTEDENRKYVFRDMSVNELFNKKNDNEYRYYAGETPSAMQNDVHLKELIVDNVNNEMSRSILWMGSKGTTAGTHYDRSYNMFAQIVGRKSFYIYPPDHWKHLYLHPSFSGSRRQCRYKFPLTSDASSIIKGNGYENDNNNGNANDNNNDNTTCTTAENRKTAMHGVLNPGELLYVPPFYFHTVVSLSLQTVSYSVLSPSTDEFNYASALYAKVDFAKLGNVGSRKHRLGVKLYLDQILLSIDRKQAIRDLYVSRHSKIGGEDDLLMDEVDPFYCKFKSKIERIKIERKLGKKKLKKAIRSVSKVFTIDIDDQGIRDILLHDLIEELLVFATSTVKNEDGRRVARILKRCWKNALHL
tara:strand:+ start:282 stop:1703 length:1422 start_codon:yes stop_codon:yes gene_type:complete